jgi:hypothetical protein
MLSWMIRGYEIVYLQLVVWLSKVFMLVSLQVRSRSDRRIHTPILAAHVSLDARAIANYGHGGEDDDDAAPHDDLKDCAGRQHCCW